MSKENNIYSRILKISGPVKIGIIVGFLYGLISFGFHIFNNGYLQQKLYTISLYDLGDYVTRYTIIFTLLSVLIYLLVYIFVRIRKWLTTSYKGTGIVLNTRILGSLAVSIIVVLGIIYYFRHHPWETLKFVNNGPFSDLFSISGDHRKERMEGINNLLIYTAAAAFVVSNLILIKFNLVPVIMDLFTKSWLYRFGSRMLSIVSGSKTTGVTALIAVGFAIILNVLTIGYKHLNEPQGMNVILISIDTLRADHVSSYGYSRNTTPNIDRLGEKGVLFENAYVQAPWTLPSMATIFTSLYPVEHGVTHSRFKLTDGHTTLGELMKNHSYNTIGVVSNHYVTDKYGFSQGFDILDEELVGRYKHKRTSKLITDRALKYLSDNGGDKFFLWIHYMDPHASYLDHPEYGYSNDYIGALKPNLRTKYLNKRIDSLNERDIQYTRDLYDEEIAFTDENIGRIIKVLEESDRADNTIIIVTSDHGEEFKERDRFGHGTTVYQELIRVPLIIYVPSANKGNGKRVNLNVETRSIAKTILDLTGIRQNSFHGDNLLIAAEESGTDRTAYSVRLYGRRGFNESESIIFNNWKLIKDITENSFRLYNLENDPFEKKDLIESEEEPVNQIRESLVTRLQNIDQQKAGVREEVELNEKDIQDLKALGYIQ